jgi:hypothetical protein
MADVLFAHQEFHAEAGSYFGLVEHGSFSSRVPSHIPRSRKSHQYDNHYSQANMEIQEPD